MYAPITRFLIAGVIMATVGGSILYTNQNENGIYIHPASSTHVVGNTFIIDVRVHANEPVNVFSGTVAFNPHLIEVTSISYNTSIADLWAEAPWYHNGDGTIAFGGGTTKSGGFTGDDILLHVTFKTKTTGTSTLSLANARLLRHDGMGTDLLTGTAPIDSLLTIEPVALAEKTLSHTPIQTGLVTVRATTTPQSTSPSKDHLDGDNDGTVTLKEISIYFQSLLR